MPSALASAAAFAKHDGGRVEPRRTEWHDGKEGTRVELYSLEGWGHGWPTGKGRSTRRR